jgi:hypothetical protein
MIYHLTPEGFKNTRRQIITRIILIAIPAAAVGLYIGGATQDSLGTFITTIIIALVAVAFGIWWSLKMQKESWMSFSVEVAEEKIIRKQKNRPDIEIKASEIIKNQETSKGLIIRTQDKQKCLFIPKVLVGYEEVRATLNSWHSIEASPVTTKNMNVKNMTAAWLTLVALAIIFLSHNKLLVLVVSVLFVSGLIWSLIAVQRNSHIDKRVKLLSWFVLLPVFSVIIKIIGLISH